MSKEKLNTQGSKSKILNVKAKDKQLSNANSYRHFLAVPHAGHKNIQWAFGLRSHNSLSNLQKTDPAPPQAFFKTIQANKEKHTSADFPQKTNLSTFQHLTIHRKGNFGSQGLLKFETSLRYDGKSKQLKDKERKWCSLPKRDRHQPTRVIKSESLRKSLLNAQDFQNAQDLKVNSKFSQKIIKTRNFNTIKHMIKKNVNLPSIAWQANLRSY